MYFQKEHVPKKRIIGIFVRTNRDKAVTDMEQLWERFGEEDCLAKIKGVIDPAIVAVYTGYSGAHNEEYTAVIGCSVTEDAHVPTGMIAVDIPGATYATLEVEGEFSEVIPETWEAIEREDLMRTYIADFEWYDMEDQDAEEPKATIYIGIQ